MGTKNAEFDADLESVKKVINKKCQKMEFFYFYY